jgi:hypothetical protein
MQAMIRAMETLRIQYVCEQNKVKWSGVLALSVNACLLSQVSECL